jgi:hypothetical protein
MSWLQSNRLGGDDVTDDQLGVLDNDTVHHKLSHVLLHGERGFGQGTAYTRTETFPALQEPEFLFPLPALLLKLSQPAAQDLLMVRTVPPALLEFREVDGTDLVGINEPLHLPLHGVNLALDTLPFPLLTAFHRWIPTAVFIPRLQ